MIGYKRGKVSKCGGCCKMRHYKLFSWADTQEVMGVENDRHCNVCHTADIKRDKRLKADQAAAARKARKHAKMLEAKQELSTMFSADGAPMSRSRQCEECGDFYSLARFKGHHNKTYHVCAKCRGNAYRREYARKKAAERKRVKLYAQEGVDANVLDAQKAELRALKSAGANYVRRYKECKVEGAGDEATQRNYLQVRYFAHLLKWMRREHEAGNLHGSDYYLCDEATRELLGLA